MILFIIFISYQILQLLALPAIVAYLLIRYFKGKPVFGDFKQRIGLVTKNKNEAKTIWIHAVSVGEILSIQHLITKIKDENPTATIYLTTGTITGKKMAEKNITYDHLSFLPFDFLLPMLIAFKRIKPSSLILAEAEIWPNLLLIAHYKKIPTYLINARINKKQNHLVQYLFSKLLNTFSHVYTQSINDEKQFLEIGIKEEKVSVLGNIKAYNVWQKYQGRKDLELAKYKRKPTLLVGSIHPGELEIYLNLFKSLKSQFPDLQLILAPRHLHWKQKLIADVEITGFSYQVWNDNTTVDGNILEKKDEFDIILVINLGVLFDLYPLCDLFFLGGTFVPIGGHNLLEPAVWSKPSIIGPYFQNTKAIADELEKEKVLIKIKDEKQLLDKVENLLNNQDKILKMGNNAGKWLEEEATRVKEGLNFFCIR